MFIKPITIRNRHSGKIYHYYRLCQSYRIGDAPRHRTILNLGKLEGLPDRREHKILADCIERIVYKKGTLFELTDSPEIKRLSEHYARIIINKGLIEVSSGSGSEGESSGGVFLSSSPSDYQKIDLESIQHQFVREVGAEWLCKQTIERLGLAGYLIQEGWSKRWIKIALVYLTGRAVFPASDKKSAEWIQQNSAVGELYGIEIGKINRHHLYKVSKMLYRDKEKIEKYLSKRSEELFNVEDKILLYDLTNTYFEGEKKYSKKAKFARSKEKRNDARLMALGLVTDKAGFIKYSRIFEGNIKDNKTLKQTIEALETYNGNKADGRKVVVMDAGISTEENLEMLRGRGYDYVCVALSRMWDVEAIEKKLKQMRDKRGNKIWVRWLDVPQTGERILYVKSEKKQLKESGMQAQFSKRYEEGLAAIRKGTRRKGGVKKVEKVYERLGRLKDKYPSVHRYYKINIDSHNGIVTKMDWERISDGNNRQGVYFVRTTLQGKDEKTIWDIYNTIREIESTFRCLKTDLNMRPVFHQRDIYSESHLYGSILAYIIVSTIRHQLKNKGIHSDWSNIVRMMNSQKVITTTMQTSTGKTIYIRKCSQPEVPVREIYQALSYKDRPFWHKKSVLPKNEKLKSKPPRYFS